MKTKNIGLFSPDCDSGERDFLRLTCQLLSLNETEERGAVMQTKQRIHSHLIKTGSHENLLAHLEYSWYSAVLHLVSSLLSIKEIPEKWQKSNEEWFRAIASTSNSIMRSFFALDLVTHVCFVLHNPREVASEIDTSGGEYSDKFRFKSFNKRHACEFGFNTNTSYFRFDVAKHRKVFRDKAVHRLYNYFVERRRNVLGSPNHRVYVILKPDLKLREVNKIRETVVSNAQDLRWDSVDAAKFLGVEQDGRYYILPAIEVDPMLRTGISVS